VASFITRQQFTQHINSAHSTNGPLYTLQNRGRLTLLADKIILKWERKITFEELKKKVLRYLLHFVENWPSG
jgi:hypothetical protein